MYPYRKYHRSHKPLESNQALAGQEGVWLLTHRPDSNPGRTPSDLNDSKKHENKQAPYSRRRSCVLADAQQQIEEYGQAARAISTASLNPSLDLHSQPIKQVVFLRPLEVLRPRETLS